MKTRYLIEKAEKILDKIENILDVYHPDEELIETSIAWVWNNSGNRGFLESIDHSKKDKLEHLCHIDKQKNLLKQNTLQFLSGYPANNALLWGPRGTGKSSLIRALLNEYSGKGLKMIEVQPKDMADIPYIINKLSKINGKFIIFCDDLTFESGETNYKILKTILDGSLRTTDQFIVYATSNRRHIVSENMEENQNVQIINREIHHSEATEEKISLSERFGIWLSFHPFSQNDYITIVLHHLHHLSQETVSPDQIDKIKIYALQWALERGSRSGRVAHQFVIDWLGKRSLQND